MEPLHSHKRGFSLVELLVVLAVIGTLSVIVAVSESSFSSSVTLSNTAYDVALSLRNAQLYSTGSKAIAGSAVNAEYGMHFQMGSSTATLFRDITIKDNPAIPAFMSWNNNCHRVQDVTLPDALPGDCGYDNPAHEKVTDFALGNSVYVKRAYTWGYAATDFQSPIVDIVFPRRDTTAHFSMGFGTNVSWRGLADSACIVLGTPDGSERDVVITSAGQITVMEHNVYCGN